MKEAVSKLNKVWHQAHSMPKNPTTDQWIAWYLKHKANYGCRDIAEKLKIEMKKKGFEF